jgi:hypothetical protein
MKAIMRRSNGPYHTPTGSYKIVFPKPLPNDPIHYPIFSVLPLMQTEDGYWYDYSLDLGYNVRIMCDHEFAEALAGVLNRVLDPEKLILKSLKAQEEPRTSEKSSCDYISPDGGGDSLCSHIPDGNLCRELYHFIPCNHAVCSCHHLSDWNRCPVCLEIINRLNFKKAKEKGEKEPNE